MFTASGNRLLAQMSTTLSIAGESQKYTELLEGFDPQRDEKDDTCPPYTHTAAVLIIVDIFCIVFTTVHC